MYKLLLLKLTTLRRNIFQLNMQSFIKILSFIAVISLFYLGIYSILSRIFGFLVVQEFIGEVIIIRLISLTFSAFFLFLIISNIITSMSTFFRSPEVEFLFSLPISFRKIFTIRLAENIIYASWASLIVDIPIIMALGNTYNSGFKFYLFAIIGLLLFLIITASIGIFLIFIMIPGFLSFSRFKYTVTIIGLASLGVILYLIFKMNNLLDVPQMLTLNAVFEYIRSVEVPAFRYMPSEYLAMLLRELSVPQGNWLRPLSILISFSLGGLLLLLFSAHRYRKLFLKIPVTSSNNNKKYQDFPKINLKWMQIGRVLMTKDIIVFFRDPTQWGQSLILMLLMLVYVFGIINSSFNVKMPLFLTFVSFANIAFVAYLMVTISVRFAYPSISLEGNSFWFIRTYTNIRTFLTVKFIVSLLTILFIGTLLVTIGNIFLNINTFISIFSIVNIFLFAWGITGINIGIGCLYPNFKEKNPSRLAAGSGGIISAVISLFYLITSLMILNQWAYHYFSRTYFFGGEINYQFFAICQLGVVVETIIFTTVFPLVGLKKLRKTNL
ncbi:MAG: hypothetical protein APR63_05715 [Desulfuromonas sp. SDB]|nr:MAG: hypothetical protein APR63_05715 [Desulfuromonas sp. SDB]